jgi:uncharacterized iron-regulated membrane protein
MARVWRSELPSTRQHGLVEPGARSAGLRGGDLRLSGTLLWWLRRPARSTWLPVAPPVAGLPLRSTLTLLLLLLGIAFPLLGATLLAAVASYFLGRRLLPGKKSL